MKNSYIPKYIYVYMYFYNRPFFFVIIQRLPKETSYLKTHTLYIIYIIIDIQIHRYHYRYI